MTARKLLQNDKNEIRDINLNQIQMYHNNRHCSETSIECNLKLYESKCSNV
jgi:hypothetical protein